MKRWISLNRVKGKTKFFDCLPFHFSFPLRITLASLLFVEGMYAQDEPAREGQQAKAFAQANDFNQAAFIYEQLLQQPLPAWQQALVLYNLGTTQLFKQQWEEALLSFYSIPLSAISSPLLLRLLYQNEGIAYLGRSWSLRLLSADQDVDQQLDFATQSLKQIQASLKIDCRLQTMEAQIETQDDPSPLCQPSLDLTRLLARTHFQINEIKQQQRDQLILSEEPSTILFLLGEGIEQLISRLQAVSGEQASSPFKQSAYQAYFLSQMDTLLPLWQRLQQDPLFAEQNEQREATDHYANALQALKRGDFSTTKDSLQASLIIQRIQMPSSQERLLLHYRLLLVNELTATHLQDLLTEQKAVEEKEKTKIFKEVNQNLEKSLEQLKKGHELIARFFLINSYALLKDLLEAQTENAMQEASSPTRILKQSLQQAHYAMWLTRLFNLAEPTKKAMNNQLLELVKERQALALRFIPSFIDAVLATEKERFTSESAAEGNCQKAPWNEVIPLFEEGSQAAEEAQAWLSSTPVDAIQVVAKQEQTIRSWQQVMQLLEKPPSEKEESSQEQDKSDAQQAPKDVNDVLRLIQEMQLQDQAQPKGGEGLQELHTW